MECKFGGQKEESEKRATFLQSKQECIVMASFSGCPSNNRQNIAVIFGELQFLVHRVNVPSMTTFNSFHFMFTALLQQ
jgi:hypothetical protein